ncbi:CENP-B N-terminal DNA-binding domain [Popillia japonica]|uniref:CENP-B N-terminal DNA-binding domain n=1 Tax=Popillia japonica TaxID=7064 RepID=A0AAW1KM60_POPJA
MSDVENDRRKRKKKGTWDPTNMRKAVEKIINNEMSARQAADPYQVPRTTLNDRISAIKRGKEMSTEPLMGRFHNTFSLEFNTFAAAWCEIDFPRRRHTKFRTLTLTHHFCLQ